jgi:hypothetical protein
MLNLLKILSIFTPVALIVSCAGTRTVDTSNLPDSYQCTYMKDICKEAQEYERQYNKMTPDEKKEFENILKAYHSQCNDALELCKKSKPVSDSTK